MDVLLKMLEDALACIVECATIDGAGFVADILTAYSIGFQMAYFVGSSMSCIKKQMIEFLLSL